jgi:hypothetical protein
MDNTDNHRQNSIDALKPYHWKKGQSGNIMGRPKGKTMKEYARLYLERMTDEERDEWLEGLGKDIVWQMAEGKAKQDTDITSNGESINPILVKFIGGESTDTK